MTYFAVENKMNGDESEKAWTWAAVQASSDAAVDGRIVVMMLMVMPFAAVGVTVVIEVGWRCCTAGWELLSWHCCIMPMGLGWM